MPTGVLIHVEWCKKVGGRRGNNARRMIEFALSNVPEDMQLILGTVRLQGAEYDGHTIELTEKYSLLEEESYRQANARVLPLLELLVQQDSESRLV